MHALAIKNLDFIKGGVKGKIMSQLLAECLIPFKIMYGGPDALAGLFARANCMNRMPGHLQGLKRHHGFVTFRIPSQV